MSSINELLKRIESARLWNFCHKDWLLQMRTALREQLPSEYRVFVESEAVLISPDDFSPVAGSILPDVSVGRPVLSSFGDASHVSTIGGTAALIEVEEECELETHYSLVIRRAPGHHIVAAIELLSPSNIGNRFDRDKYLRKRTEYLDAGINLLEIDSLLEGERDLPLPLARLKEYSRVAWTVNFGKGRRLFRGWGWDPSEQLPSVEWHIDSQISALLNLESTASEAISFNSWETLAP